MIYLLVINQLDINGYLQRSLSETSGKGISPEQDLDLAVNMTIAFQWVIALDDIRSKENLADALTKGLPKEQVVFTSRGMGLKPTQ